VNEPTTSSGPEPDESYDEFEVLTEAELAEQRRAEQRAQLSAARIARVAAVAPWVGIVALVVIAAACVAFGLGMAPTGGAAGLAGGVSGGLLSVERVLPAVDASAGAPAGVAVSGDRVYVADPVRGVVDELTRDGSRVATIGAAWLRTPAYVAVGPVDGRVYVTDRSLGQVGVFSSTGGFIGVLSADGLHPRAKTGPAWRPLALSFAPDGTLYVADSSATQSIAVFSPAGSRLGTLGADVPPGRTSHPFAFVNGIAATTSRVLAADSNNGRILEFDRAGTFSGETPVDGLPRGIAVTASGRIVLTDAASSSVALLDAEGAPLQTLTGGVGAREQFRAPAGVAIGSDGAVYVVDAATRQVFVLAVGAVTVRPAGLASSARWLLFALAALAVAAAVALAIGIGNRARARVREQEHTL
jgi:DNA-binding beta-propeller fold protein YncE